MEIESYIKIPSVNIGVKKMNPLAKLPTRGSDYAAGYDVYAAID
jgi:dUTPase